MSTSSPSPPQPAGAKPEPFLTKADLQEWLGVSDYWIDDRIKNDPGFPFEYVGQYPKFEESKVRAYLQTSSYGRRPSKPFPQPRRSPEQQAS